MIDIKGLNAPLGDKYPTRGDTFKKITVILLHLSHFSPFALLRPANLPHSTVNPHTAVHVYGSFIRGDTF